MREDPGSSLRGYDAYAVSCVLMIIRVVRTASIRDGRGLVELSRVRSMVTKTMCCLGEV